MKSLRAFFVRLGGFLRRSRREQELTDEIDSHLQLHVDDNLRAGMTPEEARRQAVLKLGSIEATKEAMRDRQSLPWLEHLAQDLRFAFRSLRKSPGFTTVAILTLALCIGANSAVFSVVHAILLKPYPWPDSDRLVVVFNTYPKIGQDRVGVTIPDYFDRRSGVKAFEEASLDTFGMMNLSSSDTAPERVLAFYVTPSLFPLLKTRAALGRTFLEDDAKPGAPKTVVLSDDLWRNRFGATPGIVGTEIRIQGESHTVIGVMPSGFYYARPVVKLWLPYVISDRQKLDSARVGSAGRMIARLKPGATIEQAQREVNAIHKANAERLPEFRQSWEGVGFGGLVVGFLDQQVQDVRELLWLIQGAVAAALLIGCTNVASLLIARASARERELAIRAALGAGRGRLLRHLLTESMLLFISGGLLGLVLAFWGIEGMNHLGIDNLPRGFAVTLDGAVFAFTLVCAVAVGLAFGALPAWSATRGDNANTLKDAGARATTGRRHLSLRSALVVTEIALALMLLATAALLIKSFKRVQQVDAGFNGESLLTASFGLPGVKYGSPEKRNAFFNELIGRVRTLPGVTSAAWTSGLPFTPQSEAQVAYQIDGYTVPAGQPEPYGILRLVSSDYFEVMKISLLRGRVFTEQDSRAEVVVIDKVLADRYWPGEDPIGKRLIYGSKAVPSTKARQPVKWEIIGVVAPIKNMSLDLPVTKSGLYLPISVPTLSPMSASLIAKTSGPPSSLIASLRAVVQQIDAELPVHDMKTMEARLGQSMERRRTPMVLLALFASIALLLAAIGVYGVLAFAVGQRTKEIGVRIALGATASNILRMVLRQGAGLVTLGLALGLAGYFALSTVIRKLLFNVETTDYAALVIAPLTLALVALAACLIPARRATKVDPIVALRAE